MLEVLTLFLFKNAFTVTAIILISEGKGTEFIVRMPNHEEK
ncbi:hypothetical protein [Bacillus sp. BF2-3]|nr:hypothetical protein [Bacillus sp. BF2-3]